MTEQPLIVTKEDTTEKVVDVREYLGWAHQAHEQCNESFIVISSKKGHPYPGCPGFRKLWKVGGISTDKPTTRLSDCEPVVGEVCITVQNETIEIVSVDYI